RRGRAAGLGMTGHDAVLPADPLEHHLRRAGLVEPASELRAIVAEYLVRDAEALQRLNKRQAHRTARRRADHGGDDAEPGMIVHPGPLLPLGAVGQLHAADDARWPHSHRPFPLPPPVVLPAAPA